MYLFVPASGKLRLGTIILVGIALNVPLTAQQSPNDLPETVSKKFDSFQDIDLFQSRLQDLADDLSQYTVCVSGGSGIVVSEDGYVLTAAHVSRKPGRTVMVTFATGQQFAATTLGANHDIDAGLIKINIESGQAVKFVFAPMKPDHQFHPGQWCVAAGYARGYQSGAPAAVRLGRIIEHDENRFLTDCRIMGGDSGGPLLDVEGNLIGITSRVVESGAAAIHVPVNSILQDWARLTAGEIWGDATAKASRTRNQPKNEQAVLMQARFQIIDSKISAASASTIQITQRGRKVALGTAVESNLILTKASLLNKEIECLLTDGSTLAGTVIASDAESDLALVQVDSDRLIPIIFPTQHQAPVAGSLLVCTLPDSAIDSQRIEAVGIATSKSRLFSLSDDDFARNNQRGFLGLTASPGITPGLEIIRVLPDSSASSAGLETGDILYQLDGVQLRSSRQLALLLNETSVGAKITLTVGDAGSSDRRVTKIALGKVPEPLAGSQIDRWGGGPFSKRRFGFSAVIPHDGQLPAKRCGGPLVDIEGNFVGINIARALAVHTVAIPADDVQRILEKLKSE